VRIDQKSVHRALGFGQMGGVDPMHFDFLRCMPCDAACELRSERDPDVNWKSLDASDKLATMTKHCSDDPLCVELNSELERH